MTTTADSWLQVPDPQNSDNKTIDVSFTQPCIDLYFDIIPYDDVPAPAVEGFDLVINHEFYEAHTTLGFEMDDVDLLRPHENPDAPSLDYVIRWCKKNNLHWSIEHNILVAKN